MDFKINNDVFFKLRFLDYFMANHLGFIAGGCFKNIFKGDKIKDIDLFFEKKEDFEKAVSYFEKHKGFSKGYNNRNVIAFVCDKTKITVELIKKTYGTPKEIISQFDFSITKFCYYKDKETGEYSMMYHECFFEDLTNNKLVLDDKVLFPASTFERSYKYKKYGYGLCSMSKKKLLSSLQGIDIENLSVDLYFGLD